MNYMSSRMGEEGRVWDGAPVSNVETKTLHSLGLRSPGVRSLRLRKGKQVEGKKEKNNK